LLLLQQGIPRTLWITTLVGGYLYEVEGYLAQSELLAPLLYQLTILSLTRCGRQTFACPAVATAISMVKSSTFLFIVFVVDVQKKGVPSLWHRSRQEGSIAKDVEDILTGRYQDGLALMNLDAIDVGLAPQTHHNDK